MKLSIFNFKSIGSLVNYEMRPLTILSGTNSSGKSSFIQLLLFLKQSLETINKDNALNIDGKLFKVRDYLDIIKDKKQSNKLKVGFTFNKSELTKYNHFPEISIHNAFDNYDLNITLEFDLRDNKITVSLFEVKFITNDTEIQEHNIKFEINDDLSINTNVAVFNDELYKEQGKYKVRKINFSSFFPSDVELEFKTEIIDLKGNKKDVESTSKAVLKFDGIKTVIKDFFANLNYVGPLRLAPKDEYSLYGKSNSVGIDGGNVAEAFYELSKQTITFFKIEDISESVCFVKVEDSFLNAVKYWLCERFKLCADIYSKKEADSYIIYVKSLSGIESTIKHVGFGISQVLPIIVEGLRIEENETLILEQPEIHLHPKVQSNLTDFLISLVEQGKKVVIETHSDHLITRLRRRIAEDTSNQLDDKVLLTFVEVGKNDVLFNNITIDDFGIVELPYPEDFIENQDGELKAILRAQMKKRLNKK
ncbi:MAG: AAA family ATPase [Bacteroidetes bacterium]|nr:AAA family ATPase [Bacteroidota bacterium]HET6245373.1 AAA family ATPase [Bacteroidia bacterium]